jgi:toxin ParE1/3/4
MAHQLIIRKTAAEDTAEAYDYYESMQPGLGDRFLAEVLERYQDISENPQYYGFIDEKHCIRDVKLRHFPYLVVYELEGDAVIVYAVHCAYRHPDKRFR